MKMMQLELCSTAMLQALLDRLDLMIAMLEERLVLAAGSNFYEIVFTGGGGMWQEGNMHLVRCASTDLCATVCALDPVCLQDHGGSGCINACLGCDPPVTAACRHHTLPCLHN